MFLIPNKILLNVLSVGLILSSFSVAEAIPKKLSPKSKKEEWKTFTSEKGGFSIVLPKTPEEIHQEIEIPQTDLSIGYDTFVSEPNESVVYVVSVWRYPEQIDMSKPDVNLQDGFGGMLSALPGSQVLSMNMEEIQGFPALEFLVKNEGIYFQGKLILVHNTLYQVFTVYKENEESKGDYTQFIRSFKLLNPEQHKTSPQMDGEKKKMRI